MKKILSVALISACIILACKSAQTKNATPLVVMKDTLSLNGTWQLKSVAGISIAFEKLYTRKIPVIRFDLATRQVSGHTSCNSFSGEFITEGFKLSFAEPMTMTKMACPGDGENVFLTNLQKITAYSFTDDTTLNLSAGENIALILGRRAAQ